MAPSSADPDDQPAPPAGPEAEAARGLTDDGDIVLIALDNDERGH